MGGDSRYIKAQLEDPELAAILAAEAAEREAQGLPPEKWRPDSADFTLLHAMVAEMRDMLADAVVILGAGLPGKRRWADPFPRPETEYDRALRKVAETKDEADIARFDDDFVRKAKERWRAAQEAEAPASPPL